jgi:hypothetical protein
MENRPFDKMSYTCQWCNHIWIFACDKIGNEQQVNTWFESVQQEHYQVCEMYRILNGEE